MFRKTKRRRQTGFFPVFKSSANFSRSPPHKSQKRFMQRTKVYVMHNVPFFWLNKFGITDHTEARRRSVSETTPGYVFHVFSPTLEFGWHLEQFIHNLYRLQNIHFWKGSGRKEWFVVFSPVVGILFTIGTAKAGIHPDLKYYVLSFFTPFVWWDGIFWLFVFSLGRMIFYLSFAALIIYLLAHVN